MRFALWRPGWFQRLLPGLVTGVGGISPDNIARQMRAANQDVMEGPHRVPDSWFEASARHQELYGQEPCDL